MPARCWLLALLLGSPLLTLAQAPAPAPPTRTYQAEHDSLQQRAARVRAATEAQIAVFKRALPG